MVINQARVRSLALEIAKEQRARKFSRVSRSFLLKIDRATKEVVRGQVLAHPSVGVTLK